MQWMRLPRVVRANTCTVYVCAFLTVFSSAVWTEPHSSASLGEVRKSYQGLFSCIPCRSVNESLSNTVGGSPRHEWKQQIVTVDVDYTRLAAWSKSDGTYVLAGVYDKPSDSENLLGLMLHPGLSTIYVGHQQLWALS